MRLRLKTAPRKMPLQERARMTVDALLTASARILVRDGYDRTSTNKVAEEAGVSIGSLYQYFPSKEALVAGVIERHNEGINRVLEERLGHLMAEPVEVIAEAMIRELVAAKSANRKLHKVLIEQVPRMGRLCKVNEMDDRLAALMRVCLEAHRAELRPINLDAALFMIANVGSALSNAIATDAPEHLSLDELVREFTAMLLGYLTPDGRSSRAAG